MAKATPKMALGRPTQRTGGDRTGAVVWRRVYIIHNY
jgi:hypothetical protein